MEPRWRRELDDETIGNLLEDSDIGDFVPSDDDFDDPEFVRPESSMSSTEGECDGPDISTSFIQARGRTRRDTRGVSRGRSRGKSRGRTRNSTGSRIDNIPSTTDWSQQEFFPIQRFLTEPSYQPVNSDHFSKIDYFGQYFDDGILTICVENTNQNAVKLTGNSLNLTLSELKTYIALCLIMASINYPILRMYWSKRWLIPVVADNMSRNRFQQLRNSLKFVFDDDITPEEKAKDKVFKMRPLIDHLQKGCRLQNKNQNICVDEMIVPFTGTCGIRQYCPGKPHPTGLKAFVLANPNGVICDFDIYQGNTTYPQYENTNFSLAEKAVLALADQLVPGHVLYFDRFFTSQKLADELYDRGILCTGTLMKNRIPHGCQLKDDRIMKSEGRGSTHVMVRPDGKLAVTKWFDNKPVIFLSTIEAKENSDFCQRWCKKTKTYLTVTRPQVVREYNKNMGGVDLADRLLAVCPHRYKTNKWTQRFLSHMIDLAVSNSWLLFKKDEIKKGVPVKKILRLREFKLQLGEDLLEEILRSTNNQESSDESDLQTNQNIPRKRGRQTITLPNKSRRTSQAKHMPILEEKQSRCRSCHYNKTHFKCSSCHINLCLTKQRNCFADFHA